MSRCIKVSSNCRKNWLGRCARPLPNTVGWWVDRLRRKKKKETRKEEGTQPYPSTSEVGRFLRKCHVRRHGPPQGRMARETRALPGRRQRGLGAAKAGSGKSVGTVSHRPFPGLPDEVGMARETRALPGRWQRGHPYPYLGSPRTTSGGQKSTFSHGVKTEQIGRFENY